MLGMGGGILYVPILLFAGFSIKQAPSISLILIAATSMAALVTYWRNHRVDWRLALVIDPPTDLMAFVGGYLSTSLPASFLRALLAVILLSAGVLMWKKGRPARSDGAGGTHHRRKWHWKRNFHGQTYYVNLPLVLTVHL